jgi:hypothetical protein
MKKMIGLLILLSSFAQADITPAQIQQVNLTTDQLMQTVNQMRVFINQVQTLINNGNAYVLPFSGSGVSLTVQQQTDIINQYNLLKAQMSAQFATYP